MRSESQVEVAWVGPFVSVAQCMRSLYRTRRVGECCTSFFFFKPGRPRDEVLEFALCRHDFIPRSCEFLQALVFAPAGAEFVLGFFLRAMPKYLWYWASVCPLEEVGQPMCAQTVSSSQTLEAQCSYRFKTQRSQNSPADRHIDSCLSTCRSVGKF